MALLAGVIFCGLEWVRWRQPDPYRDEKRAASALMQRAMQIVKAEKIRLEMPIDRVLDPGETGMIGVAFNDLTTTRGSLPSKRTSTDPAFAAVAVQMLKQVGVGDGDPVAVSFSGSFPALNIAVLSAIKVLNLQPVIISSEGASMYGANQAEMTWLDMERVLAAAGLFPYRSCAASLGGIVETGGGLDETGIALGLQAIRRNGIPLLVEESGKELAADIEKRMALYARFLEGGKPAAFINVGGSATSLGGGPGVHKLVPGLLKVIPAARNPDRGVIVRMAERGIPVIHLLGIRSIAAQYGIPFDAPPLPGGRSGSSIPGGGYDPSLAAGGLFLLLMLLFRSRKRDLPSRTGGDRT